MYNLNFNLFKSFYYVAFYGGFSAASRNINVAQSALSYNIKQLESQLNKTLIIRNNKNFELTEDNNNLEKLKNIFSIDNLSTLEKYSYDEIMNLVNEIISKKKIKELKKEKNKNEKNSY